MSRFLSRSRYFILIAVLGSFGCACVLLGYGAYEVFVLIKGTLSGHLKNKILLLDSIEAIDTFLLATLCYVVSLGLYELFIDSSIPLPEWLHITSLNDLKNKLLGVVVTLLGVLFLGQIVTWDGTRDLGSYGFSIAVVIAAITFYTRKK